MAQINQDPIELLLINRRTISDSLQTIRLHVDGISVLNSLNLGRQFDIITERLERIIQNTNDLQNE